MRRRTILGVCFLCIVCMSGCSAFMKEKKTEAEKTDAAQTAIEDTQIISEEEQLFGTEKESEPGEESLKSDMKKTDRPQRIICWGDSLTYGQGGNGVTYPSVLAEILHAEVINYGIQGETARQIAIRMGALPMSAGAFLIPQETSPVEVSLWQNGEDPIMMRLGDCAINPCYIEGIEGTLSYRAEDNKYYFTRSEAGEEKEIAEGTIIETYASRDKKTSDIIVLFAGTNLPPDRHTVGELIDTEKQMLEYLRADRYVVVGLTSKTLIPDIEPINEALAEAFGEHFLDIRSYLLENGLQDAGIEPVKKDRKNLAKGEIPSSLRVDEVHGNEAFYRIIGEQVYQKLKDLGYITEEDEK